MTLSPLTDRIWAHLAWRDVASLRTQEDMARRWAELEIANEAQCLATERYHAALRRVQIERESATMKTPLAAGMEAGSLVAEAKRDADVLNDKAKALLAELVDADRKKTALLREADDELHLLNLRVVDSLVDADSRRATFESAQLLNGARDALLASGDMPGSGRVSTAEKDAAFLSAVTALINEDRFGLGVGVQQIQLEKLHGELSRGEPPRAATTILFGQSFVERADMFVMGKHGKSHLLERRKVREPATLPTAVAVPASDPQVAALDRAPRREALLIRERNSAVLARNQLEEAVARRRNAQAAAQGSRTCVRLIMLVVFLGISLSGGGFVWFVWID